MEVNSMEGDSVERNQTEQGVRSLIENRKMEDYLRSNYRVLPVNNLTY